MSKNLKDSVWILFQIPNKGKGKYYQTNINQEKAGDAIFIIPDKTIQHKKNGLYADKKEKLKKMEISWILLYSEQPENKVLDKKRENGKALS